MKSDSRKNVIKSVIIFSKVIVVNISRCYFG